MAARPCSCSLLTHDPRRVPTGRSQDAFRQLSQKGSLLLWTWGWLLRFPFKEELARKPQGGPWQSLAQFSTCKICLGLDVRLILGGRSGQGLGLVGGWSVTISAPLRAGWCVLGLTPPRPALPLLLCSRFSPPTPAPSLPLPPHCPLQAPCGKHREVFLQVLEEERSYMRTAAAMKTSARAGSHSALQASRQRGVGGVAGIWGHLLDAGVISGTSGRSWEPRGTDCW